MLAIKEATSFADECRLSYIIHGLASGLDVETFTNDLWNYVSKDEEKAFRVANALRKSLLMDSPIACSLMGEILTDHVEKDTHYDREDNIIVHALETATDDDLICFRKMMRTVKDNKIDIIDQVTVDWAEANRLFKINNPHMGEWQGLLSFEPEYIPEPAAYKMMNYLDKIKQLFRGKL